jgi:hypothetical protein
MVQRARFPEVLSARSKRHQDEQRRDAIGRLSGAEEDWSRLTFQGDPLQSEQAAIERHSARGIANIEDDLG